MRTVRQPALIDGAFWVLLIAFEIFVLSLPLFPTGDGGLHLYYAAVLRDLITHRASGYEHYYAVRHLLQPYLLHYYALMGLETFFSQDFAEKIIVMIDLAVMALGFRSLVRALSPSAPGLSLLIFPFLFSWPLAMGAVNYTFALGLLFLALAEYTRLRIPERLRGTLIRFAVLLLLLVLSHPVPLLLLLCVIAVDLLLSWWDRRGGKASAPARPFVIAFLMTCIAFVIPMLIVDRSRLGSAASDTRLHVSYLRFILNASRLSMFARVGLLGKLYSRAFVLLLPLGWFLVLLGGFAQRLHKRTLTAADRLAVFSLLLLIATLFAPAAMNGSGYFAPRLLLPCWILGIAAAAGSLPGARLNSAAALIGAVLACVSLGYAQGTLRPVSRMQSELEHAPLPDHETGIVMQTKATESAGATGAQYPLFWWNGARAFAAHRDVLLNSAWLYLTIIPVKENGNSGLLRDYVPTADTEDPNSIARYFVSHPEERERALAQAEFLLLLDPAEGDPTRITRFLLGDDLPRWNCDTRDYFAICTRRDSQNPLLAR